MKIKILHLIKMLSKFVLYGIVLQTFFYSVILASEGNAQRKSVKEVDVNVKSRYGSLDAFFKDIESQTAFKFAYSDQKIRKNEIVGQLQPGRRNFYDVLLELSKTNGLKFKQINNSISVDSYLPDENSDQAFYEIFQTVTVTGKVTSEDSPGGLPGVNVVLKGTTIGSVTDINGKYAIEVPGQESSLVFSSIGYVTEEVTVGSRSVIDILLVADITSLDEIVVIGYGEQSKEDVTGAISQVKSEELAKFATSSFEQSLAGKAAGLVINESSPRPGESSQIIIRGTGTLTAGTNPLIVVDGFPLTEGSSINSINPNDIASIEILKDAASAAIYGSRAGNGVVLVTTKKGKSGKMQVGIHSYAGIQMRHDKLEMVDAYDAAQYFTEARDWGYVVADPENRSESDDNQTRLNNGVSPRQLRLDYLDPYLQGQSGLIDTDWYNDVIFRNAGMSSTNISISGANDDISYYVSGGYFKQRGIVIGSGFEQYTNNIKIQTRLSSKIDVGINLNTSYSNQDYIDNNGSWDDPDPVSLGVIQYPFFAPKNPDGSLAIGDQLRANAPQDGALGENVLAMVETNENEHNRFRSFGNIYLNYDILKKLTFRTSIGGDFGTAKTAYFSPSYVGRYRTPAPKQARADESNDRYWNFISENTLKFEDVFGDHGFSILAGYTYQEQFSDFSQVVASGFVDDNIESVAGGSIFENIFNQERWTQVSYLGRINYDYKGRYLLSATVRRDGSSRFGDNSKFGVFPSVSLGWTVSNEPFFSKGLISYLKLRSSWGQTGNNQIGAYSSRSLVASDNYVFEDSKSAGFATISSPNPNLSWETNTSTNIGFDMGLAKNKFSLSANYYRAITTDLLLEVPVPRQSGFTSSLQNIGKVKNSGFELELGGSDFAVGNFIVGFNANLATNKNKVLALGNGQDQIIAGNNGAFRTRIGGPIAEMYGYKIIGVFKDQADIDSSPHLAGTNIGDYKMEDLDRDGDIDEDDKMGFGTYAPKLNYAFGLNLKYKAFDLGISFTGVEGRKIYDRMLHTFTEFGEAFSVPSQYYFDNRYHPENNPDGFFARPNTNFSVSSSRPRARASNLFFKDADYLRLRSVQIGYTLTDEALSLLKIQSARVYVSANNLFTFTKYLGFNPDATYTGTGEVLRQGDANSNQSVPRIITAGINLTL